MPTIITADHTELYVKDWGAGQPVILIHGWPLSSDSWDDQAMALAQAGYRAIAYDRRGFGRSTQTWNGFDYDTLADDLAAVIAYSGAKDAVLVGFSMGGGEVARYMSRHNGKSVAKAVLVSASLPYRLKTGDNPLGAEQAAFDKTAQAINDDRPKFLAGFFEKFFGVTADAQPVSQELLEWARSVSMQASLKATLGCAKSFTTTDFRGELSAFKVPTLIIHGTNDQVVPIDASSRLTAKGIAHATLLEYPDAPHGLFATHKARLTSDLLDFLRQ
ncbi:MAG TPA: alpha/beta hydrolase [Rhodoferax sp.]|jgi:pimeloyl-ACP methyl ester carboxylesterase|nr:alpha/beta hydrolase [Rhodoferax sp.]